MATAKKKSSKKAKKTKQASPARATKKAGRVTKKTKKASKSKTAAKRAKKAAAKKAVKKVAKKAAKKAPKKVAAKAAIRMPTTRPSKICCGALCSVNPRNDRGRCRIAMYTNGTAVSGMIRIKMSGHIQRHESLTVERATCGCWDNDDGVDDADDTRVPLLGRKTSFVRDAATASHTYFLTFMLTGG